MMFGRAALLVLLAGPVMAEPAGCPRLSAALTGLTGYAVTASPAGPEDGWCVFDRAVLKAEGAPDLGADRLRLRGEMAEGALVALALEAGGVRMALGLGQRDMDPVLRETLRLQAAEVAFDVAAGPEGLALRNARVKLSGGTEVRVEADIAGAGLSAGALLTGRLTFARIDWRNDGRLLRPALEAAGTGLEPGAKGPAAINAARTALRALVSALPEGLIAGEGGKELMQLIDALPQGRGRLVVEFRGDIGAADLGLAVLSDDPLGPKTLARLFQGAEVSVDWQPGIAP